MGYGDSYSDNHFKWRTGVVIVLYKDSIEVERKSFEVSLKGNGEQFEYFRAWEANGKEYTWERL